jgi:hypothetical protein
LRVARNSSIDLFSSSSVTSASHTFAPRHDAPALFVLGALDSSVALGP